MKNDFPPPDVADSPEDDAPTITARNLATRWSCTPVTVNRMAREGRIQSLRIGKTYRFRPSWIADYERANTNGAKMSDRRGALPDVTETPVAYKIIEDIATGKV